MRKRTLSLLGRFYLSASFVGVAVCALALASCGRQVTPNPPGIGPGGALPGQMAIFFDVAAPFNFSNYQYWVIFDTTGDGATPSTMPANDNWAGYSGGIKISGSGGAAYAAAYQFVKNPSQPKNPPAFIQIVTTPQQLQFNADSNGTGGEASVIFSRNIFTSISKNGTPPPLAVNWTYNAFTTQANVQGQLIFYDSMGAGGPGVPQYSSPVLNTLQCFDQTFYSRYSGLQLDPPAQIVSVELGNNPTNGGGCNDEGDGVRSGTQSGPRHMRA
jgi:hypothetical protein